MDWVLDLENPAAVETAATGGKGASLARLRQAGFTVPPGLVVTAHAYRAFVAADGELRAAVEALHPDDPDVLQAECARIRARLEELPLPAEVTAALAQMLPALLARGPVAVRSSGTLEDLAGAAFAGQHDTYLNVATADEVAACVRRCFASLWQDRAVRYRHARGFGQDAVAMAVVIQAMVAGDVAGVGFCLNPITGDLGQVVLNAAYGLGETVVSGEGQVDQYVIDRRTGTIVERTIGEKTHALVGGPRGTRTVEVPPDRRNAPALDDGQVRALAQLAERVEGFYEFPQDIEWAIARGEVHLLQSRPVTRFPARWTRDESAERFPNVVTPLTWDFTLAGFHESLTHSLRMIGLPPFDGRWFDRFDDYIYGNQTAVQLFTSGRIVAFNDLDHLRQRIPELRGRYPWVLQMPMTWARDLDGYLITLGGLGAAKLEAFTDAELWAHVGRIDALGRRYFLPNIAISITQGLLHRMLYRFLSFLMPAGEVAPFYDSLTCYCETKTSLVNRDLVELAELARRDRTLRKLLVEEDRRTLWQEERLAAYPAFAAALEKFLTDHGHREVDWDLFHPTWSGQPWVVLENVRLLLMREEPERPAVREREMRIRQQAAERQGMERVPQDLRFFFGEILRLARAYTALDDLEHYQTTRLNVPSRAAMIEVGRRLMRRGALEQPEHVFFLSLPTLRACMEAGGSPSEALTEAYRRRVEYERHREQTPPWTWGARAPEVAGGAALRGMPGSPGVAEGKVFRVLSVADFPRFPAGAVLVARTTNPAWTPLFYSACAVVTESGGPLSHGAVTAREIGLPAVMAVRGSLERLTDGARVRVDGTAGLVTLL